jgi:hypothetical protein
MSACDAEFLIFDISARFFSLRGILDKDPRGANINTLHAVITLAAIDFYHFQARLLSLSALSKACSP